MYYFFPEPCFNITVVIFAKSKFIKTFNVCFCKEVCFQNPKQGFLISFKLHPVGENGKC